MPLKLSFKSSGGDTSAQEAAPATASTPTPASASSSLPKISFKSKSTATLSTEHAPQLTVTTPAITSGDQPKQGQSERRKPGRKPKPKNEQDGNTPAKQKPGRKRKAADDGTGKDTPSAKKAKSGGTMLNLKVNTNQLAKAQPNGSGGSFSKIKFRPSKSDSQRGLSKFSIKHVGTVPNRPIGVGYDSEDEDAEEDPAMEHLLVLRVPPGDDCKYLARMIEEKKIGIKTSDGGADITFHWLDKEGRRSLWIIRGNKYAGALFDLPTVTEVFKTWNKKDMMKVTDISQMLVILGKVENEQQAKDYPLPPEVDRERWEYPHGLTPPMKYVRKRRFRKRINYRDIDSIEAQVQKLLEDDNKCLDSGGEVTFEYIDPDAPDELDQMGNEDMEEDAEGEDYDEDMDGEGEELFGEEEVNEDDMAAEFMEDFAAGGGDEGEEVDEMDVSGAAPSIETAASHALAQAQGTSSAADTPSASAGDTTDAGEDADDGDDDEDDEGEDDELDEEAIAARQELEQQREEYEQLRQSLEEAKKTLANTTNALLKNRNQKRVDQLQNEVDLKRAALGIEDDV